MTTPAPEVSANETPRLLLIAGEGESARALETLARAGLRVSAERVSSLDEARAALARPWELAVCGSELPGLGYRDVAAVLREKAPTLPFLVLAAKWDDA